MYTFDISVNARVCHLHVHKSFSYKSLDQMKSKHAHVCMSNKVIHIDGVVLNGLIKRIVHECSCFIEFIKRVGEKR